MNNNTKPYIEGIIEGIIEGKLNVTFKTINIDTVVLGLGLFLF